MGDLNVVDQFMQTVIHYIDSGFGLLSGDVGWLSTTLIALDITLAGLFWAMDGEAHVFYRLTKKVLYVGFFALLINNFQSLSQVVFDSFSTLGIDATFFSQFISALQGRDPTLADAMSLVLASISLFGLGIFGPGIATGLVSGAPQLGAGAAIGTAGGLIGVGALAGGAAFGAARLGGGGLAAIRAASASPTTSSGNAPPPAPPPASNSASTSEPGSGSGTPAWAKKMQRGQRMTGHARAVGQAIKEGDKAGHGANPELDGGQD